MILDICIFIHVCKSGAMIEMVNMIVFILIIAINGKKTNMVVSQSVKGNVIGRCNLNMLDLIVHN